jgi:hypothetical protein
MDEGYFELYVSSNTKFKLGKGNQQLKNLLVMAESTLWKKLIKINAPNNVDTLKSRYFSRIKKSL